jgi:hypothetical protein
MTLANFVIIKREWCAEQQLLGNRSEPFITVISIIPVLHILLTAFNIFYF